MPPDTPFRDVKRKLEHHGWTLLRISGSHHIFGGENRPILSIPVHRGKVKPVYVRRIDAAIREIGGAP